MEAWWSRHRRSHLNTFLKSASRAIAILYLWASSRYALICEIWYSFWKSNPRAKQIKPWSCFACLGFPNSRYAYEACARNSGEHQPIRISACKYMRSSIYHLLRYSLVLLLCLWWLHDFEAKSSAELLRQTIVTGVIHAKPLVLKWACDFNCIKAFRPVVSVSPCSPKE